MDSQRTTSARILLISEESLLFYTYVVGQKIKKVQGKKNLVKSNKSISRKFFEQIPFIAISKMAKNPFLK